MLTPPLEFGLETMLQALRFELMDKAGDPRIDRSNIAWLRQMR